LPQSPKRTHGRLYGKDGYHEKKTKSSERDGNDDRDDGAVS